MCHDVPILADQNSPEDFPDPQGIDLLWQWGTAVDFFSMPIFFGYSWIESRC